MQYSLRQQTNEDRSELRRSAARAHPGGAQKPSRGEQQRLCDRAARGDDRAFKTLYDAYAPSLANYVFGLTRDRTIVEDIVNEAFLKAWRALGRFRGESDFGTWLTTIARRLVFDTYKKSKNTEDLSAVGDVEDDAPSPFVAASAAGTSAVIKQALTSLSMEHREVLQLMYMQEKSIQEIAELVGCPANTVKTRIFHARKKLKEIIDKSGVSYDDM